jgi:hypothetical protein
LVAAGIMLLTFLIALSLIGSSSSQGPALDGTSARQNGAKAVLEVLRQHGVAVTVTRSIGGAEKALGTGHNATLALYDPNGYLDSSQLSTIGGIADDTVLVTPTFRQLQTLETGIGSAGAPASGSRNLAARCDFGPAQRAGTISAPSSVYRFSGGEYTGCFPSDSDSYAVIRGVHDGKASTVVGSRSVFDNENITKAGNAALALGVLGENPTLVWYLPSLSDVQATGPAGPPSLGELTPGWLTPVIGLLVAVVIAAALWRGRRFGPLVVENLPVLVRAEETMEGRARLYQRSSARLRALDALRIGTVDRLASRCGLPRTATVLEVSDAVASLTGLDRASVYAVLVGAVPRSDTELLEFSDRLADIETRVEGVFEPLTTSRPHDTATPTPNHHSTDPGPTSPGPTIPAPDARVRDGE